MCSSSDPQHTHQGAYRYISLDMPKSVFSQTPVLQAGSWLRNTLFFGSGLSFLDVTTYKLRCIGISKDMLDISEMLWFAESGSLLEFLSTRRALLHIISLVESSIPLASEHNSKQHAYRVKSRYVDHEDCSGCKLDARYADDASSKWYENNMIARLYSRYWDMLAWNNALVARSASIHLISAQRRLCTWISSGIEASCLLVKSCL